MSYLTKVPMLICLAMHLNIFRMSNVIDNIDNEIYVRKSNRNAIV